MKLIAVLLPFCILLFSCANEAEKTTYIEDLEDTTNAVILNNTETIEQIASTQDKSNDTLVILEKAISLDEDELRAFITNMNCSNCYGWNTNAIHTPIKRWPMSYTFIEGGNLFTEGNDGEASMAEGTWELHNDQLSIEYSHWHWQDSAPIEVNVTFTAKISGEYLILDNYIYWK